MEAKQVEKMWDRCILYIKLLNHNQINALCKFLKMFNKENDNHFNHYDKSFCINELNFIKNKIESYVCEEANNDIIYNRLIQVLAFMLGMVMVQDEYNKYNKNYKHNIK